MKPISLLIVSFLLFGLTISAVQAESDNDFPAIRHQVSASYGLASLPVLMQGLADVFIDYDGLTYNDKSSTLGPINLQYQYRLSNTISMGFEAAMLVYEKEYMNNNNVIVNINNVYYSFMPSAYYQWYKRDKFTISTSVAAGIAIHSQSDKVDTDSKEYFAFQASPFVLSYGSIFKGFVDLGIGYRGLISFGLAYSF